MRGERREERGERSIMLIFGAEHIICQGLDD